MPFLEAVVTSTKIILEDTPLDLLREFVKKTLIYLKIDKSTPILFVVDPAVPGLRNRIGDILEDYPSSFLFDRVKENPPVSVVDEVASIVRSNSIKLIWAIGGGSTMDTAKAAALLGCNQGSLEEYLDFTFDTSFSPRDNLLICTPTTAGTGAEVTRFGVYTASSGRKYSLASPHLQADLALLLPAFTYSLPPSVTASTAFDALTHALEVLWNKNADDLAVEVAIEAAVRVLRAMPIAYESSLSGDNRGRKEMLLAATMAGIAFNITGTAAIHALSFPLSEKWHIPHGVACAFFFEDVWEINIQVDEVKRRLDIVARKLGMRDLDELFSFVVELRKGMKLPSNFNELGVECKPPDDLPQFLDTLNDPKMKNNIVPFDEKMIIDILQGK